MARLLRMPEVAANTVEAVLSDWPVAENTPFTADLAIATVETDKAVIDVPAEADGVILKTLVAAGSTVKVGDPIALLGDPGEIAGDLDALLAELGVGGEAAGNGNAVARPAITDEVATAMEPPATEQPGTDIPGTEIPRTEIPRTSNGHSGRIFASPLARRLAKDAGLPVSELTGSGPGGRIVRRDVQRALAATSPQTQPAAKQPAPTPTPPPPNPAVIRQGYAPAGEGSGYEDVPHSRMRRAIAARLTQSTQEAPHFSVRGTARVDKLLKLRARLNESGSAKISINDLIVTAAARAHVAVPAMNVIWLPDAVRQFQSVDVAVAVATDRGLVTPVLRGVDRMTVSAVAAATSDLVARARAGRLRQEELEGGTLTVTNLGVFGTEDFSAIINPPQAAILAVGAARQEPLVHRGNLAVGTVLRVTLSVDHRPVDGAIAAQWMATFLTLLESPLQILA
jgi:pyruvate dehydrogenase E2 component (dihydrolipoamide acetyltransferase)